MNPFAVSDDWYEPMGYEYLLLFFENIATWASIIFFYSNLFIMLTKLAVFPVKTSIRNSN